VARLELPAHDRPLRFFRTSGNISNGGLNSRARPSPQSSSIWVARNLRRAAGCSPTGRYGKATASEAYALESDRTNSSMTQTSPGSHWRYRESAWRLTALGNQRASTRTPKTRNIVQNRRSLAIIGRDAEAIA
jgi:hypothetical protein